MMELHHFSQDCTSNRRGAENQIIQTSINWCYKSWKRSRNNSFAKPMNPKGEKLGTCGLEGVKRSPAEPLKVD